MQRHPLLRQPRSTPSRWLALSVIAHLVVFVILIPVPKPFAFSADVDPVVDIDLVVKNQQGRKSGAENVARGPIANSAPSQLEPREQNSFHSLPAKSLQAKRKARPARLRSTPRHTHYRDSRGIDSLEPSTKLEDTELRTSTIGPPDAPPAGRIVQSRPDPPIAEPAQSPNRFSSFWPATGPNGNTRKVPTVSQRESYRGIALTVHSDGSRLLRNEGHEGKGPGLARVGLLTLASNQIGSQSGLRACDIYQSARSWHARELLLLVDTSGSIRNTGRAPKALVCAAGAALSALAKGHRVAIANFSSATWYLRPTRGEDAIYANLSRVQGDGTRLPDSSDLKTSSALPRDIVLITDTAIANIRRVVDGYARLRARNSANTARVFVIGSGSICRECDDKNLSEGLCQKCRSMDQEPLELLERAGFVTTYLDAPEKNATRRVLWQRMDEPVVSPKQKPIPTDKGKPGKKNKRNDSPSSPPSTPPPPHPLLPLRAQPV